MAGGFFDRVSVGGTFKTLALAFAFLWIGTYLGKQLGWISSSIQISGILVIIAVILAVFIAYGIVAGGFNLGKEAILPLLICVSVIVALVYFGLNPLPGLFSVGTVQVRTALQSIFSGM